MTFEMRTAREGKQRISTVHSIDGPLGAAYIPYTIASDATAMVWYSGLCKVT